MHPFISPFIHRTNKGMSLLIAMIFLPILLMLGVVIIEPIIQSYRAAAADQKRMLAKTIAQNLYETAMFATKDLPTGVNAQGTLEEMLEKYNLDYSTYGEVWGTWTVLGRPQTGTEHTIAGQYYVPSLGTGDVGGDYCSSTRPVNDDPGTLEAALASLYLPTGLIDDPADWPCNWGKIKEGESMLIPLYTYDEDGRLHNPRDLGLTTFELRARAACNPYNTSRDDPYRGEICDDLDRYDLEGVGENPGDTVIVLWEIVGKEGGEDGKDIYLSGIKRTEAKNSIFNINAINEYSNTSCRPYTLCHNSEIQDQDGNFPTIENYLQDLYKPTLRIMVIHSLKDTSGNKVPYLEYQFRTNALGGNLPIANSSKIVKIEVMLEGGYKETLERIIALPKPVTGFVIQQ